MNNIHKSIIAFCVIIVFTLCGAFESIRASASTTSYSISITPVKQTKTSWCWAACSEMTASVISPSSYHQQNAVVKYIFGSYINKGATLSQTASGVRYACLFSKNFSISDALSFSTISANIQANHPVQAALYTYDSNGEISSGHMVEIYGVSTKTFNSVTTNYISYIDPWYGTKIKKTYSGFCSQDSNTIRYEKTIYVS